MNEYDPDIHHRRSIRLKGYDYSQAGLYFITIVVHQRKCLFGKIVVGVGGCFEMKLNDAGKMVEAEWQTLPSRFQNIALHEMIVMPNHFHGILQILEDDTSRKDNLKKEGSVGASLVGAQKNTTIGEDNNQNKEGNHKGLPLPNHAIIGEEGTCKRQPMVGDIIGAFKSLVTTKYIYGAKNFGWGSFVTTLWQRNYYEHIIRDESSYWHAVEYMINNPARWQEDDLFEQ